MVDKKKETSRSEKLQNDVRVAAHKVWLAGLGALAVAEEEGSKLFKNLVERGESFESRGKERAGDVKSRLDDAVGKARDRAGDAWEKVEKEFDERLKSGLHRLNVPTKKEIEGLTQRVEKLNKNIEELKAEQAGGKGKKKSAKRKSA